MKKLKAFELMLFVGVFLCLVSLPVFGQPSSDKPASVLVYPYFNSQTAHVSLLTVTNVNDQVGWGQPGQVIGEVRIHFYYVNLVGGGSTPDPDDDTCEVTNRWRTLTPNDTFTCLVSEHNPEGAEGWVYIVAQDPQTGKAIDFDYLIGDILVANPATNFIWNVPAYGFEGSSSNAAPVYPVDISGGGHLFTDRLVNGGNADGDVSFTGFDLQGFHEYHAWPDEVFISSYIEQKNSILSYLVLLTALDSDWRVDLETFYYNDSEVDLSQESEFRCWIKQPLTYFFPGADNLPTGEGIFGMPTLQTGWARLEGDSAVNTASGGPRISKVPILGMIIHTLGGASSSFQAAHLLHHTGVIGPS